MAKTTTTDQTKQQAQSDAPGASEHGFGDMSAMMQNCCGGDMSTKMQEMCRPMAGSKEAPAESKQSGCGCE